MKKPILPILCAVLAAGLLALAGFFFWKSIQGPQLPPLPTPSATLTPSPSPTPTPVATPTPTPVPSPTETSPAIEDDDLPHDKLFITVERQGYEDGDLQLIIPKLNVDVPILNGVDAKTLLRGEGLYDYAQLPGEGNRNVSVAGHRNGLKNGKITDNMPFYYIDTLEDGDYLYLRDDEHIYRYTFEDQTVVEPDDWGPIYSQGFSCLTLTTCTPIGISDHRLIVRGRLDEIIPYDKSYEYLATIKEVSP